MSASEALNRHQHTETNIAAQGGAGSNDFISLLSKTYKTLPPFFKKYLQRYFFIRLLKNNFLWKPVGKAKTGHDKLKRFYPDSILTKKHPFFPVYCLFAAETPFTPASKVESLYPFLETFRNCSS